MANALDWDFTPTAEQDKEKDSFVVLPEGIYNFTVNKLTKGSFPGSAKLPACPKAELKLIIDGGSLGRAMVTENLMLCDTIAWKITAFFCSIGLRKHGDNSPMRWNDVEGCSGRAKVEVHKWTDEKGDHEINRVRNYLDPLPTDDGDDY